MPAIQRRAAELHEIGMVNKVAKGEQLGEQSRELAETLVKGTRGAASATKTRLLMKHLWCRAGIERSTPT
jgi:enoyl-CoA hydratase/carnithine racemase